MLISDSKYYEMNDEAGRKKSSRWIKILSAISNFSQIDLDPVSEKLEKGRIYSMSFQR